MRAALTGGTGFLGSHLAELLRGRGDEVVCLVRSRERGRRLEALGCRLVPGDLEDAAALSRLVSGAEVVFHLAGLVAARSERELLRVNRDGAGRVARAAREARVRRLVHISSLSVTGPSAPGRTPDETSGPGPVSAYGRSKRAGEEAVTAVGGPVTLIRPPPVYGPRDRELLRVFRLARLGFVPLLGSGRQQLSLIHARDLARALVAASGSATAEGRTYHAAHPDVVTQAELVAAIAGAVGRRPHTLVLPPAVVRGALGLTGAVARLAGRSTLLTRDKARELLAPAWTCSSTALRRDTGWEARVGLEAGLAETARAYREDGWL